ncbi:MAG TPA: DUF1232 domain-containing protein [Candidatus Marinimicrobia bacterium]|nr:DUF1232 domain-containing protein [Candidatus Neomarinimicrobiota bacterium]HIB31557.1 DUF1232 domain-containing protein [Candidatus Neomarinimicrobiota bacterium]
MNQFPAVVDPNLFQLTEEDKEYYRELIDQIDIRTMPFIMEMLGPKLQGMDLFNLSEFELQLVQNISTLVGILQTYPNLTESVRKRILFAVSYFCDEDDEIPDIIPGMGYLDDAKVAQWIIESIGKELPEITLA